MNTTDTYYDRHLRLWVTIERDTNGNAIPDPITGETATYSPKKPA